MAKSNRGSGRSGSRGGSRGKGGSKGAGWPAKTGNRSGLNRDNAPPKGK